MKHNWNQYKIWKYTYVHSFLYPTIKYDNCDLMQLHMTITALLPLWHWRKCKRKTTLALAFVQLCTSWTATPEYEVQTTEWPEIPEFDSLHWHPHKIEYICTLTKIINVICPFLSKRFLSFLNMNSYPCQFRNPEYQKGYW